MLNKNDIYSELSEVIGEKATKALCEAFGGTTIYVPYRAYRGHPLAAIIGIEALDALSKYLRVGRTGVRLSLPRGVMPRMLRERIETMDKEGKSAREIALACRVHERTVFRHRAKLAKGRSK